MSQLKSQSDIDSGLSASDAAARLIFDGPNALPGGQRRTWLTIILETAREPKFLLLLIAGTLYLVFGELQEGLILFGFVLVTLGLTLYQVVRILNQMASEYQTVIIVVTHDEKIIPTFRRIYNIRDGRTFEEVGEGRALE
jgi:magnesium-transporting ATPase (P-type)